MKKLVLAMILVVFIAGVGNSAIFYDDFTNDLSKWNVDDSDSYVEIGLDGNSHLYERVTAVSDGSYHTGMVVSTTTASVVNNAIFMEFSFYLPSSNTTTGYAHWVLTPDSGGAKVNSIEYCVRPTDTSGGAGNRQHWLNIYDADGNQVYNHRFNHPYHPTDWKVFADTWYRGTIAMDQVNDQVTFTLYNLDTQSEVGTHTVSYSSWNFIESNEYYSQVSLSGRDTSGMQTLTDYVLVAPEPATLALLGLGMVGLMRRKR